MDYNKLKSMLPEHWESPIEDRIDPFNIDSDRDYELPFFQRTDGLARIYFCLNPSKDCVFSIKFDYHYDGQCMKTLEESIAFADAYIKQYPLDYHKCCQCDVNAVWMYLPSDTKKDIKDMYFCTEHVPRGCSCNIIDDVEELEDINGVLRQYPCVEYFNVSYGFPIEKS